MKKIIKIYKKKRVIYCFMFITLLFMITGCIQKNYQEKNISKEVTELVKIKINGKEYEMYLENNETAQRFAEILPQELNMKELNGNEKYAYLDSALPTNSYNPKKINEGDVMLYGDDCLVIFYKSFNTSYSYTKIGHIENLPNLGKEDILIKMSLN